jgi:phage shock protein C
VCAQPRSRHRVIIAVNLRKRLYRSQSDRVVAGVAGGMAEYLGIDPTIVRILWVLAFLPGGVPGLVLYLLCWLVMPREPYGTHRWD